MSTREHNERIGTFRSAVRGLFRRMAVTLSGSSRTGLWQVLGFTGLPGDDATSRDETLTAEPFLGIGFYSRPGSAGKPEAIVVNVGGSNAPAIIAVRDEATRKAIAGAIKAGETMVYTPAAVLYMKDDGTVEIRSSAGAAQALATKADVDALANWIENTMSLLDSGGDTTTGTNNSPPVAAGTTVLKGE